MRSMRGMTDTARAHRAPAHPTAARDRGNRDRARCTHLDRTTNLSVRVVAGTDIDVREARHQVDDLHLRQRRPPRHRRRAGAAETQQLWPNRPRPTEMHVRGRGGARKVAEAQPPGEHVALQRRRERTRRPRRHARGRRYLLARRQRRDKPRPTRQRRRTPAPRGRTPTRRRGATRAREMRRVRGVRGMGAVRRMPEYLRMARDTVRDRQHALWARPISSPVVSSLRTVTRSAKLADARVRNERSNREPDRYEKCPVCRHLFQRNIASE